MNKYPFILIFDIDNTVIGDVKLLHQEAQLLEYIYNTCKKEKIGKCKLIENINMQKELKTGMLRPNIKEFIKFCDSKFKNVEIFFYTGSPYKWTNTSLGSNIEKVLNIKIKTIISSSTKICILKFIYESNVILSSIYNISK